MGFHTCKLHKKSRLKPLFDHIFMAKFNAKITSLLICQPNQKFANISVQSLLIRVVLKKIFWYLYSISVNLRPNHENCIRLNEFITPLNRFAENYITFGKISLRYLTFEGWRWLHALKVSGFIWFEIEFWQQDLCAFAPWNDAAKKVYGSCRLNLPKKFM